VVQAAVSNAVQAAVSNVMEAAVTNALRGRERPTNLATLSNGSLIYCPLEDVDVWNSWQSNLVGVLCSEFCPLNYGFDLRHFKMKRGETQPKLLVRGKGFTTCTPFVATYG